MLKTDRLVIKPYDESDSADMVALLTNACIKKTYMLPASLTEREALDLFSRLLSASRSDAHYERGVYENGALIGFFNDVSIQDGCIEIGYVIHPRAQGKGYATEAFRAVLSDLFDRGFQTVEAGAFFDNRASRRVMEKCGLVQTEKTERIPYRGRLQTCVYYKIDRPVKPADERSAKRIFR